MEAPRLIQTIVPLLIALTAPSLLAGEFRAGAAAVVITPPPGTPVAGYYQLRTADGVLDDLYAKALVVEQDGAKAALVTLDLITITRPVVNDARRLIAEQVGIPGERVMISATHSHTGPVLTREASIDELTGGTTPDARDYTGSLPALIAQSVTQADRKLTPSAASATRATEERISCNRRFWMADGKVAWNPAKMNPAIVATAGPIDPEVGVLHFQAAAEGSPAPIATYVNFALHPDVVGGSSISADYPGVLARHLAKVKGEGMVTLFANGCCGNINHRNVWWQDPQRGPGEAERIGTVLAGTVLGSWPALQKLNTSAPRGLSTTVKLPVPQFTEAEIAESRRVVRQMKDPKIGTVAKAKAFCVMDTLAREGKPYEVEVQVIAFSDEAAVVSLPGEIFVELGLAIKKASPFKHTFIAELANGSIGYIPNRAAYAEGNYEVVSARVAEGSGEMLVDPAVAMLLQLKAPVAGR